jgi:polyisoprenoid-binding protein YceI
MARDFSRPGAAFALAALLAAAPAPAFATDYVQAPGSKLAFATKYQGEVFVGTLPDFSTRLRFDPAQLDAASLDVVIPLADASIDNPDGTEALRGRDFFDVARFPQARFVASRFRALGGDRYAADGTLSLRGASRPVTLEFTWTPGARPVLTGSATVKRLDFGVGGGDWADTGLIPNEVAVSTRVVLIPAK